VTLLDTHAALWLNSVPQASALCGPSGSRETGEDVVPGFRRRLADVFD